MNNSENSLMKYYTSTMHQQHGLSQTCLRFVVFKHLSLLFLQWAFWSLSSRLWRVPVLRRRTWRRQGEKIPRFITLILYMMRQNLKLKSKASQWRQTCRFHINLSLLAILSPKGFSTYKDRLLRASHSFIEAWTEEIPGGSSLMSVFYLPFSKCSLILSWEDYIQLLCST